MDNYLNILVNKHKDFINDVVNTYFSKEFNKQILVYFRIYFFYYLITTFVYKPNFNINEIKKVFFLWLEKTLNNQNKKYIIKNFEFHFNYLFKVFFVDKNIYFHVYFNNLIKYFLPLPFELNIYSPLIVYRSNVKTFYKKNNTDYLDQINKFDGYKMYSKDINNEIDIHIPLEYFDESFYDNLDIIYLVATKNKLFITDVNKNILYSRINDFNKNAEMYFKKFNEYVVFEELFPVWSKDTGSINFKDVYYINVMKKITANDLLKVFRPYNLTIDKYKYLFHNAFLTEEEINSNVIFKRETFFYIIPSSKSKFFTKEEKRKCLIFKINKDIDNLLDLTSSIVTNNNFTKNIIIKDKNNKVWMSYDPLNTMDYFKNGIITTKFDDNFKCLTLQNLNLKNRKYCDVFDYSGRRKLQEILFKTRKYPYKKMYISKFKNNPSDYDKYKFYHPENVPINITWDFDKFILKQINVNGFFSIDYGEAVDGGEILLINPSKYLEYYQKLEKSCYET